MRVSTSFPVGQECCGGFNSGTADISHILKRPDMYVGSIRSKPTEEFVGDIIEQKFEEESEEMFELVVGGDEKEKPISPERKNLSSERKSKKKDKFKLSIKKETIDFSPAILRIFVRYVLNHQFLLNCK